MIEKLSDWLGLNLPEIVWSSNYNISASTVYQILICGAVILGIVLVISLLRLIFDSILSFVRAR